MIIGIEKVDDTKMLIDTDHKLADEVTLKNIVILISCVIKEFDNFYPQMFLEGALVAWKLVGKWYKLERSGKKVGEKLVKEMWSC